MHHLMKVRGSIMNPHWKEIIPGDSYIVSVDGPFNEGDQKILSFLYQPLIGPVCISLYLTLKQQIETNKLQSEPYSHYFIMNLLNLNLMEIYQARNKLEAIGLLQTFVKKEGENRQFLYILNPPLSAEQFFSDGLLNIYLYQKVGREYYNRLKASFTDSVIPRNEFQNITKSFQEVFTSQAAYPYTPIQEEETESLKIASKGEVNPIKVIPEQFDFDLLLAGLNEAVVPKRAITKEVREVILKLAFLYEIDPIQMKNIILSSITNDNQIDIERLRKAARDWYTIEHYSSLPKLVDKVQSPLLQSEIDVPKTKEERLIRYLETVSPRQLLQDMNQGNEPVQSELQLIENLMINQKLPPGVVNVLIQYCLLRTDMKLSKSFVETIASHWGRKKIKTVVEAMELAKLEHRKYLEWQKNKKNNKPITRKVVRSEKVPEWFENRDHESEEKPLADLEATNFEEEKRKMEERLKKYKNRG